MASFLNSILDNTKQLLQQNTTNSNTTHSTTSLLHNSNNSSNSNSETHSIAEEDHEMYSKKQIRTSSQMLDNGTFLFDSYDQEYCEIAHHIKEQFRQLSKSLENNTNSNTSDIYKVFQKLEKQVQMAQGAVKNMEIELRGNLMDNHSGSFDIKEAQERVIQYKRDAKDLAIRLEQSKQAFLLTLHNENTLDSEGEEVTLEEEENFDDLEYGNKAQRNFSSKRKNAKQNKSFERMELLNKKSQNTIDRMLGMTHSMNQSGEESMTELGKQRETIQQSRNRVREMDNNLSITRKLIGGLEWNEVKTKLCIFMIIIVLSIAIAIAVLILIRRILGWVGIKIL